MNRTPDIQTTTEGGASESERQLGAVICYTPLKLERRAGSGESRGLVGVGGVFVDLIEHLLASNLAEIVAKSRLHCHAKNVHSVMLLEAPGKTIRLFVATPGHDLGTNTPQRFSGGMSVGFHAHHCELTLVCVRGRMLNWTVRRGDGFAAIEYAYKSSLTGGKGGFERMQETRLETVQARWLVAGESVTMPASEIHTVACDEGEWAAWLVFEGREDAGYDSACFSTSDLEKIDLAELYRPATESEIRALLAEALLLRVGGGGAEPVREDADGTAREGYNSSSETGAERKGGS